MAQTIEELTVSYEEDGVETTRELDKRVLTKGAWSTIIYRFQNWDYKLESYGPDKYTIRRYQKRNGFYQPRSKFNISSRDQAHKIIDVLAEWLEVPDGEGGVEKPAQQADSEADVSSSESSD